MLGKSLIRTMATFFFRIRSRCSYKLNKIYWELSFFGKLFSSLFVSQAVSIEILAKNDTLNLKSAFLVICDHFRWTNVIFWSKMIKKSLSLCHGWCVGVRRAHKHTCPKKRSEAQCDQTSESSNYLKKPQTGRRRAKVWKKWARGLAGAPGTTAHGD